MGRLGRASCMVIALGLGATVTACRSDPTGEGAPAPPPQAPPSNVRYGVVTPQLKPGEQPFPDVRIDFAAKTVEFDATVPIDAHNEDGVPIFLELIACSPDTREHESLVVTDALPSNIHAALLLIGLESGRPGGFRRAKQQEGATANAPTPFERIAPEGDAVRVEFVVVRDGVESAEPAASWVVRDRTGEALPDEGFVFAGSRFVTRQGREWYDADGAGTLIGLHTFGSECVAWRGVMSPESTLDEPVWVADVKRTPPIGTRVIVRLSPAK